jgi:hypothetical protein
MTMIEVSSISNLRPDLCEGCVLDYMESLDATDPIVVYQSPGNVTVASGNHRVEAARRLRWTHIRAEVRPAENPYAATLYRDQRVPGGCGHSTSE